MRVQAVLPSVVSFTGMMNEERPEIQEQKSMMEKKEERLKKEKSNDHHYAPVKLGGLLDENLLPSIQCRVEENMYRREMNQTPKQVSGSRMKIAQSVGRHSHEEPVRKIGQKSRPAPRNNWNGINSMSTISFHQTADIFLGSLTIR